MHTYQTGDRVVTPHGVATVTHTSDAERWWWEIPADHVTVLHDGDTEGEDHHYAPDDIRPLRLVYVAAGRYRGSAGVVIGTSLGMLRVRLIGAAAGTDWLAFYPDELSDTPAPALATMPGADA